MLAQDRPPPHGVVRRCGALSDQRPHAARRRVDLPGRARAPRGQGQRLRPEGAALRSAGRPVRAHHHDRPRHRHRAVSRLPARTHGEQSARAQLAVLRPPAPRLRFLLRGRVRRHEGGGRADPAFARLVARRRREVLRPGSHARGRPRPLGLARRRRAHLCLRRCQTHGQGCRGRMGRDRGRARCAHDRRGECVRRQSEKIRALSAGRILMSAIEDGRDPAPAHAPRMQALARLPIFLALDGKRAVIAGNGAPAAWKAELLSAAGADVAVFAERPCEELRAVAAQAPRAAIVLQQRPWRIEDIAAAAVAIGGFDDEAEAERFAGAARAAGVPVNVIDRPAYCDFSFGAIVNRSPLVIGISTDGAAPVFGQAIRTRLEAMIPRGFARWADPARRWRKAVQSSGLSSSARRRFWRDFAAFAVRNPEREPASSDFDAILSATKDQATAAGAGSVTLVSAGSGDPELLTLRAVRALQSADVILIDDHLSPDMLDFARREAKTVLVGSTGPSCREDEVAALMIALAKAGGRVVRLKGGSPMFGRADGEIAACRGAGLAVEVAPGGAMRPGRGETRRSRANSTTRPTTPIPGTPLRACCGSPAARPAHTARALRSTSRG